MSKIQVITQNMLRETIFLRFWKAFLKEILGLWGFIHVSSRTMRPTKPSLLLRNLISKKRSMGSYERNLRKYQKTTKNKQINWVFKCSECFPRLRALGMLQWPWNGALICDFECVFDFLWFFRGYFFLRFFVFLLYFPKG